MKYLLILLMPLFTFAQTDSVEKRAYHFQQTLVSQVVNTNDPVYVGHNSFVENQMKMSMSSTFYLGFKLSKNTSIYINPDVAGGSGLGGTLGVAGCMNGEIFRVGNPAPAVYFSRCFIRQYIPLKNTAYSYVKPDANQLGEWVPDKRIQISLGKLSLADMFDCNHYSHDPRTRFLNWSLMNSGSYDFASNTKGYTYASVVEYITPKISNRFAVAIMPVYSNGPLSYQRDINGVSLMDMEFDLRKNTYGLNYEIEIPYEIPDISSKNGRLRVLTFLNFVNAGTYTNAIMSPYYKQYPDSFVNNASLALSSVRSMNVKYGFSVNIEQPLGKHSGVFSRISWNDGKTESFCFAEIDQSESFGVVLHGTTWNKNRFADRIELAFACNQISQQHINYLAGGGYGFMLGEPHMRYAPESIFEIQYVIDIDPSPDRDFMISPDIQFIVNPGYDSNRSNLVIFGVRSHIDF